MFLITFLFWNCLLKNKERYLMFKYFFNKNCIVYDMMWTKYGTDRHGTHGYRLRHVQFYYSYVRLEKPTKYINNLMFFHITYSSQPQQILNYIYIVCLLLCFCLQTALLFCIKHKFSHTEWTKKNVFNNNLCQSNGFHAINYQEHRNH